jgi:choline dehydrogenase-like flavoprotein
MAAQTLVESGARVHMLDAGVTDEKYKDLIPEASVDFAAARQTDTEQSRYLLGDEFEVLGEGGVATGAQLTPPRMHIAKNILSATKSSNFFSLESFAYGGLGAGWGLGCCIFSDAELGKCGLDAAEMKEAYQVVADRIGMSGSHDDASPYTCGTLEHVMPSIEMDANGKTIFQTYTKKKSALLAQGFYLGRPSLALLTQDKDERKKYAYRDLDYYSDKEESAYRPWITVNQLKKKENFTYTNNALVIAFRETNEGTQVEALDITTNKKVFFSCKKLILAAGVLQTARIVMRSQGGERLPLLCNPYHYIPSLTWGMLGKQLGEKKIGFAQLSLFYDKTGNNDDVAMASIYSYNELMMFRVIRQLPLNFKDARVLLQYLMPALTIYGIHYPQASRENKYIELKENTLSATYLLSDEEKAEIKRKEKQFLNAIKKLGSFPLKVIDPGMGASIHYAGTLPFSAEAKKFSLSPTGQLSGTSRVFVADGSGFAYLPAKGPTFSLMANAHRVADHALKHA